MKIILMPNDTTKTYLVGKVTVLFNIVAVPLTLNNPKAGEPVQLIGIARVVCGKIAALAVRLYSTPPKILLTVM